MSSIDEKFSFRSGLEKLEKIPGQLLRIKETVDPYLEISGIYTKISGGAPLPRPTSVGPALFFENVKDHYIPVVAGYLGSRKRAQILCDPNRDTRIAFIDALKNPIPPTLVSQAPCQEVVIDKDINLAKMLPIPTMTDKDAGPFIVSGVVRAADPVKGNLDVTYHRMCVVAPDELSIMIAQGHHLGDFLAKAEEKDQALPASISIGVGAPVALATTFCPPMTLQGFDELALAGGVMGAPVGVVKCKTVDTQAIAQAEIVLEGEIQPKKRIQEDISSKTGHGLPEFQGYESGPATTPVFKIKTITHRRNPIYETLVNPGEEHVVIQGIPTEVAILQTCWSSDMPLNVVDVNCHPVGGGKGLAIIKVRKLKPGDEGCQVRAALMAFNAHVQIRRVIVVDEDVDIWDSTDVLWAFLTRFSPQAGLVQINLTPNSRTPGIYSWLAYKDIYDCTVPLDKRKNFQRPKYKDMDLEKFVSKDDLRKYVSNTWD